MPWPLALALLPDGCAGRAKSIKEAASVGGLLRGENSATFTVIIDDPKTDGVSNAQPSGDLSLRACFEHFGVTPTSRRPSWCVVSADGKTVVVTMWADELEREGDRTIYRSRYAPTRLGKAGLTRERIAALEWACAHTDHLVKVIVLVADDPAARHRKISYCYPDDRLVMRITRYDENTGAFQAERSAPE